MIEITVTDTGAGISPEITAQLFQPFVTTKRQGMGVGLSITSTIVEAHGGSHRARGQIRRRNGVQFHFAGGERRGGRQCRLTRGRFMSSTTMKRYANR